MYNLQNILLLAAAFGIISLAAQQIGQFLTKAKLPLISGFLFAGIVTGPFVLGLIPEQAGENLRFVDEISLAVIAFAAGSELYLKELRNRFKSIIWVTVGNTVAIPLLGGLTIFLLSGFLPFMQNMSTSSRLAVSLLASSILVARSPSSAIALVNELRAKGPFTRTVLGVTMITDVAVIFLFAFSSSVADAVSTSMGFDLTFIVLLFAELLLSLALGYIVGRILEFILSSPFHDYFKTTVILLIGYGVFVFANVVRDLSHEYLSFELFLEPLLVCMLGSFVVTNYSRYRQDFLRRLEVIAPPVYIAFFTLTGATLALDVLLATWPIALAIFGVRLLAIFAGSFAGGTFAGDPLKYNRLSWMTFITQAGVGLGLAKEVAVEFPVWGSEFATIIISVIVLSQLVGPPFFKWAITHVGESHTRAAGSEFDGQRDAVIFGMEGQSLALARQLHAHGWQVKIATRLKNITDKQPAPGITIQQVSNFKSAETLHRLEIEKADAIISLLPDEESYRVCELVYENFGTKDMVVRLNDRANFDRFHQLGALIVDPATAIVSLYDHLVRSPSAAPLLLGLESNQDIVDIEIRNPNLHGVALRDLRLPLDTLILSVYRRGRLLISHGYTRLKIGDRVTVVGSVESLDEVMLRFDI